MLLKNPANVILFIMAFLLGFSILSIVFSYIYLSLGALYKWPYETVVVKFLFYTGSCVHIICFVSSPILFLLKIRKLFPFLYAFVIYIFGVLAGGLFLQVWGVIFDMNLMNKLIGL